MSAETKWEVGTTLRLTMHLWRRLHGRYGVVFEAKCSRALRRNENEVHPMIPGDRVCRRCFPSENRLQEKP